MSKEQTPIDFLKEKGMLRGNTTKFVINGSFGVVLLNDLLEQYAQAKVLEALERVKSNLTERTYTDSFVSSNAFEELEKEIAKQK